MFMDKHKVWLIAGISIVIIVIAFLVLYSPLREGFAGQAIAIKGDLVKPNLELFPVWDLSSVYSNVFEVKDKAYILYMGRDEQGNTIRNICLCRSKDKCPSVVECVALVKETKVTEIGKLPKQPSSGESEEPTERPPSAEICNNGMDDDNDNLVDCNDLDCYSSQNAPNNICELESQKVLIIGNGYGSPENRPVKGDYTTAANACQSELGFSCVRVEQYRNGAWVYRNQDNICNEQLNQLSQVYDFNEVYRAECFSRDVAPTPGNSGGQVNVP